MRIINYNEQTLREWHFGGFDVRRISDCGVIVSHQCACFVWVVICKYLFHNI